jgi:hypothetical protein
MATISSTSFTPELITDLRAPFPWDVIEVRPGAVRKDGTGALALAYADPRVYEERLDDVVGPDQWSVEFAPWGEHRLICRLTIFGVVKCSTGEADPADKNAGTVAEAQAFKRACAKFGIGRYLYHLAQIWAKGTGSGKSFVFTNPDRIIAEMRHRYDLAHKPIATHTLAAPDRLPAPARPARAAPASKQATARDALALAERRTGVRPT